MRFDVYRLSSGENSAEHKPQEAERLFYQGYQATAIKYDVALAYYRYERIIQDVSACAERILLTDDGGADRAEGLYQLTRQFLPGQVIELAGTWHTDRKNICLRS